MGEDMDIFHLVMAVAFCHRVVFVEDLTEDMDVDVDVDVGGVMEAVSDLAMVHVVDLGMDNIEEAVVVVSFAVLMANHDQK